MAFRHKPPRPGDPEDYQLIKTKEGAHWRRKRGTVKPVSLNQSFLEEQRLLKLSAPASRLIVNELKPYLIELDPGRVSARISAALRKDLRHHVTVNYHHMQGMDLQPRFPFNQLFKTQYQVTRKGQEICIHIPSSPERVIALNNLVTEYYFTAVLVSGDPVNDGQISTDSISSPLFSYLDKKPKPCALSLALPDTVRSWMLLLKVSSLEGNEMAAHYKHYGMKVIAVSGHMGKPCLEVN